MACLLEVIFFDWTIATTRIFNEFRSRLAEAHSVKGHREVHYALA
jgi:hypothetical protein